MYVYIIIIINVYLGDTSELKISVIMTLRGEGVRGMMLFVA